MAYTRLISLSKQSHDSNASIKANAKELRNNQTLAEKKLWKHLRRNQINGMYFRRQHPYGIYILDFYCFRANLAIEIDGPIHLFKQSYDNERDDYLRNTGTKVLRFTNEDIYNRIEWVIEQIKSFSPLGETGKGVDGES